MKGKPSLCRIIFTGGGSGGHFFTCYSLIEEILRRNVRKEDILYIGSHDGLEKKPILSLGIEYQSIHTGKLKRSLKVNHFKEFIFFMRGFLKTALFLFREKKKSPFILFSSGGFISVAPVVLARLLGATVLIHEQTSRVGLSNKIGAWFATDIFIAFESSRKYFSSKKNIHYTGNLIRKEYTSKSSTVFEGILLDKIHLPIVLVTGGGNGSKCINDLVLPLIKTEQYFIFHQTGERHFDTFLQYKNKHYHPFGFSLDISSLIKQADVLLSRSGALTVSEIIYLRKKAIFIPLQLAQKNEQYYNALEAVEKLGFGKIIEEKYLPNIRLEKEIKSILNQSPKTMSAKSSPNKAEEIIIKTIEHYQKIT